MQAPGDAGDPAGGGGGKENAAVVNAAVTPTPRLKEAATVPPPPPLSPPSYKEIMSAGALLQRNLCIDLSAVLGEGCFGTVYAARHVGGNAWGSLAVKIIPSASLSAKARGQLEKEVALQAQLTHPHIVGLVGAYSRAGSLHLVMKAHAGDVGALLRRPDAQPLLRLAAPLLIGALLAALQYLHDEQHIVHADLKPSNLLVDERGTLLLCDLGAAARVDTGRSTLLGAPAYLAPEVVVISHLGLLDSKYSFPADMWSCGIILAEMLTGSLPFAACARDLAAQQAAICFRPPALGNDSQPAISRAARSLVLSLLAKQPYLRPTAAEALEAPFCREPEVVEEAGDAQAALARLLGVDASHETPRGGLESPGAPSPQGAAKRTPVGLGMRMRRSPGSSVGSSAPGCQTSSSVASWVSSLVEDDSLP